MEFFYISLFKKSIIVTHDIVFDLKLQWFYCKFKKVLTYGYTLKRIHILEHYFNLTVKRVAYFG